MGLLVFDCEVDNKVWNILEYWFMLEYEFFGEELKVRIESKIFVLIFSVGGFYNFIVLVRVN